MLGGFSFCGVDVSDLGLVYAPELADTYVYGAGKYNLNEQTFDGHDGGYFYGTTVQPKSFTLRCYFENSNINEGTLSRINAFFRRGRTGKLIFQNRDWVWYSATVVGLDCSKLQNYLNGFVTITMKAYYPFARHDEIYMTDDYENYGNKLRNSALLYKNETPTNQIIALKDTLEDKKDFLLYNGGSEAAATAIEIAGDCGDGVIISNLTTGQQCKFVAFNKSVTSDADKYIVCDGLNGKTFLTNGESGELSFLYHDGGFIDLAPAYPIERNIVVSYTQGSIDISSNHSFSQDHVGKYVLLNGAWRKIVRVLNTSSAYIENVIERNGEEKTYIVRMNELTVRPVSSMSLTKLNFIYKPTFS